MSSLSEEEVNYLRLEYLLIRISPRAVRKIFDSEFHPQQLKSFLRKNVLNIKEMRQRHLITQAQFDLLYPRGKFSSSFIH